MSDAGSYSFDGFTDSQQELARLAEQARQIEPFESAILQNAGLAQGMRALDIGCGPGIVSCLMARLVGESGQVLGADTSDDLLGVAAQMGKSSKLENLTFTKADINALDMQDDSFDFIYSRLVFQHLPDPQHAMENLLRVLKPGGILCISDIDDKWLSIAPELPEFQKLIDRSTQTQAAQGGDRFVGHKLGSYMQGTGFDDVDVKILPVTSKMLGMKNFLNLGLSFRVFAAPNDNEQKIAAGEFDALQKLGDDPNAWGYLAVFVAAGTKPTDSTQTGTTKQ